MPPARKLVPLPSVTPSTLARSSAHRTASGSSSTSSTTGNPPPAKASGSRDSDEIERQRLRYQAQVQNAHMEEDDPLAVYKEFVEWMVKEYSVKSADTSKAQSELGELLKKATEQFKDDEVYKQDLRYLKLWVLYIAWVQQDLKTRSNKRGPGDKELQVTAALDMYEDLETNGIGTSFSMFYEEYAKLLETHGKYQEADRVYSRGLDHLARPIARLKTRSNEFKARCGHLLSASRPSSGPSNSARHASGSSDAGSKPTQHHTASSTSAHFQYISSSSVKHAPPSSTESRYAVMLAPPIPGKRQEKMMFQMALLFADGMEYSIQEARAKSVGLLGKKWGPPPSSEMRSIAASTSANQAGGRQHGVSMPVDFNDNGQKNSTKSFARRRSLMIGGGPEPTMTINTKEALNDVFGMYNSPEKTMKSMLPGSKHAPLKKVEPITPLMAHKPIQSQLRSQPNENENAPSMPDKTPTAAFRPFVDENSQAKRPAPSAFTPFVDSEAKTPAVTPRAVLSLKDPSTAPSSIPRPSENASTRSAFTPKPVPVPEAVFSRVFTPADKPPPLAPLRDVFTDDHGKPQPRPKPVLTHERARSHHDVPSSTVFEPSNSTNEPVLRPQPAFKPFVDENIGSARTPFRVFSRPGEEEEELGGAASTAITPKPSAACRLLTDKPTFTPYRDDALPPTTPAPGATFVPPSVPTFTPYLDSKEDESIHPHNDDTLSHVVDTDPSITSHTPPWSNSVTEVPGEDEDTQTDQVFTNPEDQYTDDYAYDEEGEEVYENPPMVEEGQEEVQYEEEGIEYQDIREVPLGGRFGQFNVMTPITERTYEFTGSVRSAFGFTPSQRLGHIDEDEDASKEGIVLGHGRVDEDGAVRKAELLAAELKEEEEEDPRRRPVSPLRLSIDHPPPPLPHQGLEPVFGEVKKTGGLSLGDSLALTHSFRPQNPCNPFDPRILSSLLSLIPTDAYFHDLRDQDITLLEGLQKFTKKAKKGSGDSASFPITLKGQKFSVFEKLGEGGFGSVFKAQDMGMRMSQGDGDEDDEDDEDVDGDDDENSSMVALKVVKPRNLWEYHVLRRLHTSLPQNLRPSLVLPHALYAFRDESFLVLELCPQGMLLSIINNAVSAGVSQQGACLDELLVIFFTIELLRLIEAMHNAGFIHGDLKIDNCLLRLEDVPGGSSAWSGLYQPSGEGGWKHKGLKLIDFGRTIDTKLFSPGHQYIAEWDADERDCFEVREGRPWTYQTDYFGLAGIIYCMLFGKYIQSSSITTTPRSSSTQPPQHKISTPFKRYWQKDIWNKLFDLLLNPCSVHPDESLPISNELAEVRKEMEVWLQANCNRTSNTLKGLLKKVEMSCLVG
ncbi:hypothetical protein BDN72DRAFT_955245 [Pluteus cervinus]|uniref:Uncharacterized protein n=1 Tax=Pluteus cervinus TaxID=181527 RepID=A0ACD3BE06_9AGAR|nr:hypothetical protein BDN72DRAFT_955245 [Pluteus cervinus]